MHDLTAQRTLVKSPPELWSELSELERLARHLGAFGEIEITRLEPEHTVAWEGEAASGTVSIEPSGWGTRVTLSARVEGEAAAEAAEVPVPEPVETAGPVEEPEPEPEPVEEPEPVDAVQEPEPRRRRRFLEWFLGRGEVNRPVTEPEPEPEAEPPTPEPDPPAASDESDPAELARQEAQAVLEEALESLGSAHHRPFSRG
jgi:hypothetical protein